ncbi:hypothetical protein M3661_29030 [Paenibacillus sp. MER 180]|uniref:hypothetical protein n=1 Tax=Paenibacillus sp. MER 180 TaxID=2939570 RepID=UPI00203F89C1|nr:hypothetical protein [Paenibacillus sp. MER 180]MCM3294145.1 hypothetical protein [Paenibacillus sp. MER 180]
MKKIIIFFFTITFIITACSDQKGNIVKEGYTEFHLEKPTHMTTEAPFNLEKKYSEPVLKRGEKGEWDSIDLLNPSVIKKDNTYYNYYSGFDGSVWRTGLATSTDGEKWTKNENNPILGLSEIGWDTKYIAANGAAVEFNDKVYYYYQGMNENGVTQIGLATSNDGITFKKEKNPTLTLGDSGTWDALAVADPYVIKHDNYLIMYYLGMNELGIQRLGVAKSTDGLKWEKSLANPILDVGSKGSFDVNGLGEPSVVYNAPYFYMIYTGRDVNENRDIGLAISLDGINWSKVSATGIFHGRPSGTWDDSVICDTTLILEGDQLYVWYGGGDINSPDERLNGNVGLMKFNVSQDRDYSNFDPNSLSHNKKIASQDILKGSYPIENSGKGYFVWLSKDSNIKLKNSEFNSILINGYVPFSMHAEANDKMKDLIIKFTINGHVVEEKAFTEDIGFEIPLYYSSIKEYIEGDDYFELGINISNGVIPYEVGASEDRRELSIILSEIKVVQ